MLLVASATLTSVAGCGVITGAEELSVVFGRDGESAEPQSETENDTPSPLPSSTSRPAPSSTSTTTDAAAPPRDATAEADAPAPRVEQTFVVGASDCGGGRCGGGYDGVKEFAKAKNTADKQCLDRGFARALDITIGGQPGGRFCSWDPNGKQYACDPGCSGCNLMASVTCEKP